MEDRKNNYKKEDVLKEIMSLVDDHKDDYTNFMYLEMCNMLKTLHDNLSSPRCENGDTNDANEYSPTTQRIIIIEMNLIPYIEILNKYKWLILFGYCISIIHLFNIKLLLVMLSIVALCVHIGFFVTFVYIYIKYIGYRIHRDLARRLNIIII